MKNENGNFRRKQEKGSVYSWHPANGDHSQNFVAFWQDFECSKCQCFFK